MSIEAVQHHRENVRKLGKFILSVSYLNSDCDLATLIKMLYDINERIDDLIDEIEKEAL